MATGRLAAKLRYKFAREEESWAQEVFDAMAPPPSPPRPSTYVTRPHTLIWAPERVQPLQVPSLPLMDHTTLPPGPFHEFVANMAAQHRQSDPSTYMAANLVLLTFPRGLTAQQTTGAIIFSALIRLLERDEH
ncbi:hypothetical protein BG000_002757 [Podila horticola]|nr:hypothetical protein BG000_002757 [Podila horticola]